jgi:hypothetical protein
MRDGRRWWQFARGARLAIVFVLSALMLSTVVQGMNASAAGDRPLQATAPSEAAPSEIAVCGAGFVDVAPFDPLPGGTVHVAIMGFPPNTPVTVTFVSLSDPGVEPAIGSATTDAQGDAAIDVVIPLDAGWGDSSVRVTTSDGCYAEAGLIVLPSHAEVSIDDDSVVPGQRVTLTGGGFLPDETVAVFLDGDPRDALCRCRELATGRTTVVGTASVSVRIPRNTTPGRHDLLLIGPAFVDPTIDLGLVVRISVAAVGTTPPTDTE